jgi:hypothetical protein
MYDAWRSFVIPDLFTLRIKKKTRGRAAEINGKQKILIQESKVRRINVSRKAFNYGDR